MLQLRDRQIERKFMERILLFLSLYYFKVAANWQLVSLLLRNRIGENKSQMQLYWSQIVQFKLIVVGLLLL